MSSALDDVSVTILAPGADSRPETKAVMIIPLADLQYYARRPEQWLRATCAWVVGSDGILEASTDNQTYTPVVYPPQCLSANRFYRFTALDGSQDKEQIVNLAHTRHCGVESVTPSSREVAEEGAKEVSDRDGSFCVFTLFGPPEMAHIVPHRVERKGRWGALTATRFPGLDINGPENLISLTHDLHLLIDQQKYAILPFGDHLTEVDVHLEADDVLSAVGGCKGATCHRMLLQQIVPLPAPNNLSTPEQDDYYDLIEHHRVRFHNRRPQFKSAIWLPSKAVLGYKYASTILNRYGTAETRSRLDQDYTTDQAPVYRRKVKKDEDAETEAMEAMFEINYSIHVAPYEVVVDALVAKRTEERRQAVQEWVVAQQSTTDKLD